MKIIHALILLAVSTSSIAASKCEKLYPYNKQIVVSGTTELCNSFYVSAYDETKNAVIFTVDLVRPHNPQVERSKAFKPDSRIANPIKTTEYSNSGFDRGHMTPAGDAVDSKEMDETFLLTNVVPQNPTLNRTSWRELEESIRKLAVNDQVTIKVLTVAQYKKPAKMGVVPIPEGMWKVVYHPKHTEPSFYYALNKNNGKVRKVDPIPLRNVLQSEW